MNCNEEFVIRLVGKISLEYPSINQLDFREIVESSLYGYNVFPKEQGLIKTDIPEKVYMYLATKKIEGLSELTLKSYKQHLMKFSKIIIKPINMITPNDIRMYLMVISENKKRTSISTETDILRAFFQWCKDEEIINKNPMKNIKNIKEEVRLRTPLNIEELEILRCSCETLRERAILELFMASGVRLQELVNLNKDDINYNTMSFKVFGKGSKERMAYFSAKTKIYLQKYILSRNDNCEALFVTTKYPIKRLGRRSIEREIEKISNRTDITKNISPHVMRTTLATNLLINNTDIATVQKILGHTSPTTTIRYAQANDTFVHSEYNKHLII